MERKSLILDPDTAEKLKKLKKKAVGGLAAGTVAAGVLLSGLFGSSAELTDHSTQQLTHQQAVVQMVDMDAEEEEEENENDDAAIKSKRRKGIGSRIKEWILRLPVAIRAIVGVPLWAVGWGITSLVGLLWNAAAPVVLPVLVKFLILAAVLFAIVFLVIKLLHPDWPAKKILKKMLQKKNWLYLLIGAAVLAAADTALIAFWDGYDLWRRIIIFVLGLVLLFLLLRPFLKRVGNTLYEDQNNKMKKIKTIK